MTQTAVWSERIELHASSFRDCTYSSRLTCLVYGGWRTYPLGIWTAEEREALERSDDQPDETGASKADADVAVRRRYGLASHPLYESIGDALQREGQILDLAGTYAAFPAGHPLRRWQPGFTGPHSVAVACGAALRWYDPLAPNQWIGDPVSAADVLRFAYGPSQARIVFENEYAALNPPDTSTGGSSDDMGPIALNPRRTTVRQVTGIADGAYRRCFNVKGELYGIPTDVREVFCLVDINPPFIARGNGESVTFTGEMFQISGNEVTYAYPRDVNLVSEDTGAANEVAAYNQGVRAVKAAANAVPEK